MIPKTRESSGSFASRSGRSMTARVGALRDVELDDLHLAAGEHVGLARRGHADRP